MSTYFFMIFEAHYTGFRHNACLEEYMDLSPRLRSGSTSEDIFRMVGFIYFFASAAESARAHLNITFRIQIPHGFPRAQG